MDQICAEDVQIVVLGTGDEKYENMFRHFDWKYNNRVSANIYYSEDMSHKNMFHVMLFLCLHYSNHVV